MPHRDRPTPPIPEPAERSGARQALRLLALTLGITWTAVATLEATPVRPGEPALLAWARLAAEHPVRLGLAVGLLLFAAGGRGGGLPPGKDPPGKLSSQGP